jgi:hypothetical protein
MSFTDRLIPDTLLDASFWCLNSTVGYGGTYGVCELGLDNRRESRGDGVITLACTPGKSLEPAFVIRTGRVIYILTYLPTYLPTDRACRRQCSRCRPRPTSKLPSKYSASLESGQNTYIRCLMYEAWARKHLDCIVDCKFAFVASAWRGSATLG